MADQYFSGPNSGGIGGSGPISSFGSPGSFAGAANQQASDYDKIMANYGNLVGSATNNPITAQTISPTSVTPQTAPFAQSSDVTGSLANLSNLSQTGGYTAQGKADILARDVSPTRGIYANAQQNMDRQRALSGGYSPSFNAASLANTQQEANTIGGIDTAANAGIAQNVAANQIQAGGMYSGASENAQAQKTQADQNNANIVNSINESNANRNMNAQGTNASNALMAGFNNRGNILSGIGGQANLYGTTPALTNTFGNQVMAAGGLGQGQQQLNQQKQRDVLSAAGGSW